MDILFGGVPLLTFTMAGHMVDGLTMENQVTIEDMWHQYYLWECLFLLYNGSLYIPYRLTKENQQQLKSAPLCIDGDGETSHISILKNIM